MGRLAKIGIAEGNKVPVEGLLSNPETVLDFADKQHFARKCLESFGFLDLADKLTAGEELTAAEIEQLIRKASFPVLMKLVELVKGKQSAYRIVPALFLPFDEWSNELGTASAATRARQYVRSAGIGGLHLFFDFLDFDGIEDRLQCLCAELSKCDDELTFVAPPLDRLIESVMRHNGHRSEEDRDRKVKQILNSFRELGFAELEPSSYQGLLGFTHELGFANNLITQLSRFSDPRLFARELHRLNSSTKESALVCNWLPVLGAGARKLGLVGAAKDLYILRVLAVGAICLPNVPYRSVWGRELSLDALIFASNVAADGILYAAVDEATAIRLGGYQMSELGQLRVEAERLSL